MTPTPEEIREFIAEHGLNFRAKLRKRYPQVTGPGIDSLCETYGIALPVPARVHHELKPHAKPVSKAKGAGK